MTGELGAIEDWMVSHLCLCQPGPSKLLLVLSALSPACFIHLCMEMGVFCPAQIGSVCRLSLSVGESCKSNKIDQNV